MGVAAGVGGQARRDKSEIGAVTRFRDMFHKFGKKFGKFRVPTRRRRRGDGSRVLGSILWRERASCCSAVVARCGAGRWPAARRRRVRILGRGASVRLQMVGLGATRPCVLDGRREPQMLAAWRRPPRGAPTGPRCPVPRAKPAFPKSKVPLLFLSHACLDPPYLETLFDKHPRRLLKECPVPSA